MKLHLILDLTPAEGSRRQPSEDVQAEVEALLEQGIDVGGWGYEITVLGAGNTAKAAEESARLRRGGSSG